MNLFIAIAETAKRRNKKSVKTVMVPRAIVWEELLFLWCAAPIFGTIESMQMVRKATRCELVYFTVFSLGVFIIWMIIGDCTVCIIVLYQNFLEQAGMCVY